MAARLEDAPGEGDRVRDAGDGRNGAALEAVTFHDRRVQLDRAVSGEDRAAARVETRIVLEHAHRALDRVERGTAGREHPPSGQRGGAHARTELVALGRIRAGAAVDDDGGYASRRGALGG